MTTAAADTVDAPAPIALHSDVREPLDTDRGIPATCLSRSLRAAVDTVLDAGLSPTHAADWRHPMTSAVADAVAAPAPIARRSDVREPLDSDRGFSATCLSRSLRAAVDTVLDAGLSPTHATDWRHAMTTAEVDAPASADPHSDVRLPTNADPDILAARLWRNLTEAANTVLAADCWPPSDRLSASQRRTIEGLVVTALLRKLRPAADAVLDAAVPQNTQPIGGAT